MAPKCFSLTRAMKSWFRLSFSRAGLKSVSVDLPDGTTLHCWIPKTYKPSLPNLVLIHGMGSDSMWQWRDLVHRFSPHFNVYAPDLVFFGTSYTTSPERSESFQGRCVAGAMESLGVGRMHVAGCSYGGIIAYSMAAQFPERVERVVLCCAGVSMEEKDMDEGMFQMKSVDEAVSMLLPQTPEKSKELIALSVYKPPKSMPSCIYQDFIDVMLTENLTERAELIRALHKDRKLSNLPKISQPTLMIWGEYDKVFPLELAHRLKRHLDDAPRLVVIKDAGHILSMEAPKELYKHTKEFLLEPLASSMYNGKQ
ncbi:hypothetical protein MLD38_030584 [Melastoma candidum]|uniref:Uncharacterized protein n=1 Tax=Melastoma candidum TaxID=119954 RepID=A0ACB9MP67_9MYRT|nr:hypothetical protein MLD38_030584 [Melastoma candidum]